jgi:hypothetical protein
VVFGFVALHVKITPVSQEPRSFTLVALVVAFAALVITIPVVAGGKTWGDVRYHTQVAPARMAAAAAVQGGALPGWWENSGLGVPLAAEPSHGALYPPLWIANSSRALDLVMILHLAWAALGIAVWARRRTRGEPASEPAVVVVALLAIAGGLFASLVVRGALPSISQLPWIGASATWLAHATPRRDKLRATIALAAAIGAAGLGGVLAALVDGLVIALAIGIRQWRYLLVAVIAGLAIAAVQWLPALLFAGDGAGEVVNGLPMRRVLELVVPGSFGGASDFAPSLFVGAGLFALAAVRTPPARVLGAIGAFVVLALVAGRGGWNAWLGAPELHIAALVIVLAPNAANGLDDLVAGRRRAIAAIAAGIACAAIGLIAVVMKNDAPRVIVDGVFGLVCLVGVAVIAWRQVAVPLAFPLLLLANASAIPSVAPTVDRSIVDEPQAYASAAMKQPGPAPVRVFRPVFMTQGTMTLEDSLATLSGSSASRWGFAAARSEDPARLPIHDRTWLAAAREGGALLDRFGIGLPILPETVVASHKTVSLASRGSWALTTLPVAPPASVMRGTMWSTDPANTLDLLFPTGGGTGVLRGTVVLAGTGTPATDRGPATPCEIERWEPGAIDLACTTDVPAYAAISSSTAAGWNVTVDGSSTRWRTADALRRAVSISPGTHHIAWRYRTPGLFAGLALAGLATLALAGLGIASRRTRS